MDPACVEDTNDLPSLHLWAWSGELKIKKVAPEVHDLPLRGRSHEKEIVKEVRFDSITSIGLPFLHEKLESATLISTDVTVRIVANRNGGGRSSIGNENAAILRRGG